MAKPKQRYSWGPVLRRARLRCVLTQRELARRVGVSWRTIFRWEDGTSAPRLRHWNAYVAAFFKADPHVAAWLVRRLRSELPPGLTLPPELVPRPVVQLDRAALELALFRAAEELHLPAGSLRSGVVKVLEAAARGGAAVDPILRSL
jgi:DNA-binding XRE family transcriptional regulator